MNEDTNQQDSPSQASPTPAVITADNFREQFSYYAKSLLDDLGLADVGQPERGQLLAAIESLVQKTMVNVLLENLTDEQAEQAEGILQRDGTEEDVIIYLLATTPDMQTKMADALTEMYARMINESQLLAQAISKKKAAKE